MMHKSAERGVPSADNNKNLAGDTERISIPPQSEAQVMEQIKVLLAYVAQAETAQMPPLAQEETSKVFAGTPLESAAEISAGDHAGDETMAASVATFEPVLEKTSWSKRVATAGAAVAVSCVGFGTGTITHAAVMGDGQDFYEQGYEDGVSDQGYGDEDEEFGPDNGQQGSGNGQQRGPGDQQRPGSGQQRGPDGEQGDTGSTRPGPPPEGGRSPGGKNGSQGSEDPSTQGEGTTVN